MTPPSPEQDAVRLRSGKARDPKWIWMCRFYYNDTVKPPKRPGDLAIETVHASDSSKDIEVTVGERRRDIGKITIQPINRRTR